MKRSQLGGGGMRSWPALALGVLLVLAGCSSRASTTPGPGSTGPATILATDADYGLTFRLHPGDHLVVTLSSTYWSFPPSSNPSVLRLESTPTPWLSPGCVPGQGCGTVTAEFLALAAGGAQVVATRTVCGEALACSGDAARFGLTATVTSPGQ